MTTTSIDKIAVHCRDGALVHVPVPYQADRDDIGGVLRAYVATLWMTVTHVTSVRVANRPHDWPQSMPVARVRVDNNGGEPFDTEVNVDRGWLSVIRSSNV